jgi:hypothetical protein
MVNTMGYVSRYLSFGLVLPTSSRSYRDARPDAVGDQSQTIPAASKDDTPILCELGAKNRGLIVVARRPEFRRDASRVRVCLTLEVIFVASGGDKIREVNGLLEYLFLYRIAN